MIDGSFVRWVEGSALVASLPAACLRALVLSSLAIAALPLFAGAPARLRRAVLTVALAACLGSKVLAPLVPVAVVPAGLAAHAPFVEPTEGGAAPPVEGAMAASPRALDVTTSTGPRSLAALVWALVALGLVARSVLARLRANRLGAKGVELEPGVVVTSDVDGPVVVGALRPKILLPPAALEWDAERLGVVLAHERAHIAARDGLAKLVAELTCAVHWPVPTVWWLARRLGRECELAADEAVVEGGMASIVVADHLVAVARDARTSAPSVAFGMASELSHRVTVLLEGRTSRWSRAARRGAFVAISACLSLAACARGDGPRTPATPTADGPKAAKSEVAPDPALATIVNEERARAIAAHGASDAVVLVMDASTRVLVATSGDPDKSRVPGSTVKPLLYALALDDGTIGLDTTFDCGNGRRDYGAKVLEDASPHGVMTLPAMLAVSSNVGASRVADRLGAARTLAAFRALGLGAGLPASIEDGYALAVLASGEGLRATPRALVAAYGALVDGTMGGREVMRRTTADAMRLALAEVVYGNEGTGGRAAVDGVRIAGKTGTSEDGTTLYASFVGFVPARAPRWVVYVGIDAPSDRAYGGKSAAPAFARVVSRLVARP